MSWDVYPATVQVEDWIGTLSEEEQDALVAAVEILSEHGPSLGRPYVDRVHASRHQKMKELRPHRAGQSVLRILFAFTSERRAALLIGGDKADGGQWNDWYDRWLPEADRHLDRIERELRSRATGSRRSPRRRRR